MKPVRRNKVDVLLTKGDLSGAERDAVFEAVFNAVARKGREAGKPARWPWLVGATLGVSALTALVVLVPRRAPPEDRFRPKGAPAAATRTITMELHCQPGALTGCAHGSTLLFAVEGAPAGSRVAAHARSTGAGERIWYFSAEGESPAVEAGSEPSSILRRGVRIGGEHEPGQYEVTILVTRRPLSRAALLERPAGEILAERRFSLRVTP